ncbi:HDOD domain-containing protein [Janthinobacterium aquaticum]|uniref:HDOD domain-containing protein n=1 Tax=Janthinobacterium sp. FT58W TaxID=2654254 RepID=UPI00126449B8|nr:HDOD domain-containing protein [Janthinobacterium sp. FT58W]KAB8044881.1 HDOD domain-containing protein [Janthinobacterium sp. FT58W]
MIPGHFTAPTQLGKHTLEQLWSRTRQQGDMPGFAKAISAILGAMRGEDDQQFDMTQTVLSDPVLTHKVLRLANSGMYSAFGQRVNTVSKAVLVLGIDAIGHLALGLKLIEELSQATPDSVSAHVEMEKAVLAGMVAQQVATSAGSLQAEQAVVCSMLHTLGRMMVTFYMPDYWARLQAHGGPGNEAAAAEDILGLSLPEVGYATAAHWGLPQHLINGMRPLEPVDPAESEEAVSSADWMAGLSTMSARCADLMWHDDEAGAAQVQLLIGSYAGMLGVQAEELSVAVDKAKAMAAADLTIAPLSKPAERRARQLASTRMRAEGNRVLIGGLAELRSALGSAKPGQMVSMALETLHQGFDFSRSVAFVRNHKERQYAARISMGAGMADLQSLMVFADVYEPNVFHAALNSDRVIFIDNARDPKFSAKLPQWWKSTLSDARSFVVVPLSANGHPAGFLYGDWDDSFPPIQLNQTEFNLINDIRAILVQSVEMRHQLELVANKVN